MKADESPTSSWKALRTLAVYIAAGLMAGCGASMKNDLPHMAGWVRYLDVAILVAASCLFFLAGVGMIRNRAAVAEMFPSLPGGRIWWLNWCGPRKHHLINAVLGGLFALICGVVCFITAVVLVKGDATSFAL